MSRRVLVVIGVVSIGAVAAMASVTVFAGGASTPSSSVATGAQGARNPAGVQVHGLLGQVSPATTSVTAVSNGDAVAAAGGTPSGQASTASPSQGAQSAASPAIPAGAVGQSSKVEESGSVDLSVHRGLLQSVMTKLMLLATADGGFVANSQTQSADGSSSSASVTLQIPEASFSDVVTQVQALGKVESLSTKGADVTGQYVDLQSRIAALRASRDQYLTIMSRASSIGDILSVQNQLDTIQSQIEQLQGQLQVLDNQTSYGTLAVSLTVQGAAPSPAPRPASGLASAWHATVNGFVDGFEVLVRIAGPLLFVALCLIGIGLLARLAWHAKRRWSL